MTFAANILLPIDGSANSVRAADYLIRVAPRCPQLTLHVLHVEKPVMSGEISAYVTRDQVADFHRQATQADTAEVRRRLDAAGLPYTFHVRQNNGEPAEAIVRCATELGCDGIVMGTRGLGALANLALGSVATRVIHLAEIPVTLIR